MNDQHAHAGYAAHDGYQNGSFEADPLFGGIPDGQAGPDAHAGYESPQAHAGSYDSGQWGTGAHQTVGYDTYGTPQYDTSGTWAAVTADSAAAPADVAGQWDSGAWPVADQPNGAGGAEQFDNSPFSSGEFGYDAAGTATGQTATVADTFDPGQFSPEQFNAEQFNPEQFNAERFGPEQLSSEPLKTEPLEYEATAQWTVTSFDSGAYDTTAWNSAGATQDPQDTVLVEAVAPDQYHPGSSYETATESEREPDIAADNFPGPESLHMAATMTVPTIDVTPRTTGRTGGNGSGGRGRRRTPAKRSALLTVAVPSACVMGVAGIAAASVGGLGALSGEDTKDDKITTASAPDEKPAVAVAAAANEKLNSQLATLSEGARDFGDRASRTQERIDLQARQEADRKKRLAEAIRKEAERPKFALPVSQHGLSAYYGQAGVNWMSMHTGIDFPVSYGTPVMAATDGTVRTQYNSAYGNMAIVTSPDGTETWYCHLSSTKIRSGTVKAGDVIAYSGNSGNSTGPHLHFEVRPGGGSAIDPLQWLRTHTLDPT
ncbi:M23 family metallopeptidase [Streptomyces sp. NPDC087658]|uniref:M23 family metallopeptidase n=1 Tax=Streptomyces sp. NPDC087658 TaxID=3365800 RepID=UPI0038244A29